ncbi:MULTISPECIES: winged helix-turn-helix transcriptional regulator [Haloferax]|uniref:winged helix-turn-helix transcriptional regulator n=1 Tax=Haloferax TaxID=2251 RepID=UPI001E4F05AA|nr:helix-turn-helix domain-containing protein [Haloferax mediterranei]
MAQLIGRKWNLVIIATLLNEGPMGFSKIESEVEGISNKVLAESLRTLEEHGVINRDILSERPFRVEYSLTKQGAAFEPLIERVRYGDLQVTSTDT